MSETNGKVTVETAMANAMALLNEAPASETTVGQLLDAATAPAASGEDTSAAAADAPVPTCTQEQAKKTLAEWSKLVAKIADHNYDAGALAFRFVDEYTGAAPGVATTTIARKLLVEEWSKTDDSAWLMDPAAARRMLGKRLDTLLAVHAVATLIGDGRGIDKGNGTRSGRGKGAKETRIAWTKLREFRPLVERENGEHAERWHILANVADEARELLVNVASSGMAVEDVKSAVVALVVLHYERAVASAPTAAEKLLAEAELIRWQAKVPSPEAPPAPAADTTSAAPDASASPAASESASEGASEGASERKAPAPPAVPAITAEQAATLTPNALAEHMFSMLCGAPDANAVLSRLMLLAEAAPKGKFDARTVAGIAAFLAAK